MATKKIKTKKPTIEAKLREKITELETANSDGSVAYQKLGKEVAKIRGLLNSLFLFVKGATAESKGAHRAMSEALYSMSSYRNDRGRAVEELSIEEIITTVQQAFLALSKDFVREDEGTALMEEHKRDLLQIIGTLTHDDTRVNPKLERLAILSHNIELSKKDNRFLNVNDPDQYRHN